MVIIRTSARNKATGGYSKEVGEIDTRAPFQSVKAAISLFGEVAVSRGRRTSRRSKLSSENVIDKETQLLLAQKELQRIKQQLDNAEAIRSKALVELDKANTTLHDLSSKLKDINELKQTAFEAAEVVKVKAKQLEHAKSNSTELGSDIMKQDLDDARKHYSLTASELDAAKQELNEFRQDFEEVFEAKLTAFQLAAVAQQTSNMHSCKVKELQKEIATMRETAQQLKYASVQALEEQIKIWAAKNDREESYKISKDETYNKLMSLKNIYDHELTRNLELKFADTSVQIKNLQEEMKRAHASEMKVVKVITAKLNVALRKLQQVAEEEISFRNMISVLKQEIENVRKKNLAELEKLKLESGKSKEETEDAKKNIKCLKHDVENDRKLETELEKKLQVVLEQAEKAKAAEKKACDEMKGISEESAGRKIRISGAEFKYLQHRVDKSSKVAEETVVKALSKLEAINASKEVADKKMKANMKAIEEIKTATEIALKGAETVNVPKTVVIGALHKFRHEHKEIDSA